MSCSTTKSNKVEQLVATTIKLADEKLKRNLPWQAIDVYEKAYAKIPDYRLLFNEALVYGKMERYVDSVFLCDEGIEKFDDEKNSFIKAKAFYLKKSGMNKDAKATYELYLENVPDDNNVRTEYMIFCKDNNYIDEAFESATYLWENKVYNSDVVEILHSVEPDKWEVMLKVFPPKKED